MEAYYQSPFNRVLLAQTNVKVVFSHLQINNLLALNLVKIICSTRAVNFPEYGTISRFGFNNVISHIIDSHVDKYSINSKLRNYNFYELLRIVFTSGNDLLA